MFIDSITKMEQLVDLRPDLEWDGWDVVLYKKNSGAQFEVNGVFKNGQWYNKFVYPITEKGWSIPDRIGREDV